MRDFEIAEAVEDTPEEAAVMSDAAAFFCAGGVVQEPGCEVTTVDTHKDFDIKNKSLTLFRIQNFSWGDQGYTTMRRYLRELPELLDKQFSTIADLTYDSFGDEEGVDTLKFRRAITMYTMRTKGIVDDSYLYYEVNQLVKRPVKSYCKTITCFPQLTTKTHYATFIKQDEMKHSEKVGGGASPVALAALQLPPGLHALPGLPGRCTLSHPLPPVLSSPGLPPVLCVPPCVATTPWRRSTSSCLPWRRASNRSSSTP